MLSLKRGARVLSFRILVFYLPVCILCFVFEMKVNGVIRLAVRVCVLLYGFRYINPKLSEVIGDYSCILSNGQNPGNGFR